MEHKDPAKELEEIISQMQSAQTQDEVASLLSGLSDDQIAQIISKEEEETSSSSAPLEQPTSAEPSLSTPTEEETPEVSSTSQEPPQEPQEEPSPEPSPEPSEEPSDPILSDPVLKHLSLMSPEERVQWAVQNGHLGVIKLMELQRIELEQKLQDLQRASAQPVLDQILSEWAEAHSDILSDPVLRDVAEGLDQVLMERKGKTSYTEFSPSEFKAHLQEIVDIINKLRPQTSQSQSQTQPQSQPQTQRTSPSISDISGGTPPNPSLLNTLTQISETDPLKLEEVISKIPSKDLDQLLAQLEE